MSGISYCNNQKSMIYAINILFKVGFISLILSGLGVHAQDSKDPKKTAEDAEIGTMRAVKVVCLGTDQLNLATAVGNTEQVVKVGLADTLKSIMTSGKDRNELQKALRQLLPPVGSYFYHHLGSGFIIGDKRQYLVTNFHVANACPVNPQYGTQLGIIQPVGSQEITAIPADEILRPHSDPELQAKGLRQVHKPNVICDSDQECKIDDKIEIFEDSSGKKRTFVRLTQPKDAVHFLPDIAVLKLRSATLVPPLEMDFRAVLKTAENLEVWGFPSSSRALQQDDSNRWSSAYPFLTPSNFIRTTKYGNTQKVGLKPEELFSQDMLLISAQVHDGNSGGPLLNKEGKVVGVVTQAFTAQMGTAYGQATPVIMVKSVLDFLGITEEVLGKPVVSGSIVQPPDPCVINPKSCEPAPGDKVKNWLSTTTNQAILAIGVLCLAAACAIGWMRFSDGSKLREDEARKLREKAEQDALEVERKRIEALKKDDPIHVDMPNIAAINFSLKLSNAGATHGEIVFPTPKKMTTLIAGRDPKSAHFVFDADATDVGRLHAQFTWSESHNKLFVEDLKSTNGTFVNGTRIQNNTMVELKSGDTVDLGIAGKNRFTVRKH